MEGRERLEIDTEVPSNVYALNLHKLSELAHIPEVELVRGMQSDDAVDMQGVVVNRGQEVPFEAVGKTPEDDEDVSILYHNGSQSPEKNASEGVKQVLLTAASSTMCLDGSDTPKCLLMLGEYTLIEHILAQLFVAGMERVVIIISYFGHEIMEHVKDSFLYSKLDIEFLNLGEETPYGHARTLLSAREMFTKPFLIHTADHIFDRSIINRMAHFQLDGCVACVLVDTDTKKLKGLPSTAGKVLLDTTNGTIRKIGRRLKQMDAIDAGLFLTTGRIFAALEMLAYERPKFSLAEALNVLRPSYGLKYLETAGDTWLSIETQEQLDAIVANNSIEQLSPWPVFVAKEPSEKTATQLSTSSGKNVFLAVSAADDDSMLRAIDTHARQSADVFEGYVVGVTQLQEVDDSSTRASIQAHELTPLLNSTGTHSPTRRDRQDSNTSISIRRKRSSFLEQAEDSFVLSIPFAQSTNVSVDTVIERNAYLIELPRTTPNGGGPGAMQETSQQFVLAVPDSDTLYKRPGLLRRLSSLPTDVRDIAVETVEFRNGTMELQLLVKRQVPLIGYVLLLAALFTISSMGAALDLQRNVDPFLKLFWRTTASIIVFIPLAGAALYDQGLPQFSRRNLINFLICSLSYAVYLMTFLWSLSHTSIDHAYIFNNCHSLLMVVGRLLLGRYVSQFEGLGTVIGVIGGALTTLDHQQASSDSIQVVQISLAGDLVALVGAVGGALYLITAKRLRTEMDITILFVGMFSLLALLIFPMFSLLNIPFEASRDPEIGLFGWLDPSRAVSEAYIVLVCTLVGTLGYVAVMKYFAPIVVSVVMLVEPVLAAFMGVAVGVGVFPGLITIMGSLLVIAGTALVVISNSSRTQTIDATQAMSSTSTTLPQGLSSATAAGMKFPKSITPTTALRYV
ncbi:drug metabolite transporter superfamily [Plasmopara halstedii]|uniref:Drug metabolite transporter superfamily n=1 Tax=Plasmopara halstedii TaxID=4781 RepID=A0A0P1A547_PLAHL|nr:drug metabolite transporter superfamily [Plasmopara halstedii]CEG35103.1 drug metabolite transporter superfamily [Plasmopara halstedii]|eukprot:XP_024571472.1 drug metabolite transporter superfamily [Plasmopara halstedii]